MEGSVEWYDARLELHTVAFDDGRQEALSLPAERVRVLGRGGRRGAALAATPHGEVVWGRVKGFPFWPALVVGEVEGAINGRMKAPPAGAASSLVVQYFGTAEHGRCSIVASKAAAAVAVSFEDGMVDRLWSRSKDAGLRQALTQAEAYLRSGELSDKMGGSDWPENPVRPRCVCVSWGLRSRAVRARRSGTLTRTTRRRRAPPPPSGRTRWAFRRRTPHCHGC